MGFQPNLPRQEFASVRYGVELRHYCRSSRQTDFAPQQSIMRRSSALRREAREEVAQRAGNIGGTIERSEMTARKPDQGGPQQFREWTPHRVDRQEHVTLAPEYERRDAADPQYLRYVLGLPWVEVP